MKTLLILITGCTLIYVPARYKNNYTLLKIIQPVTTLFVILLASLGLRQNNMNFSLMILLSLTPALAGDCRLIDLSDNKEFFISVLFYWLGLMGYIIILGTYKTFTPLALAICPFLLLVSGFIIKKSLWEGMVKAHLAGTIIIYTITWAVLMSLSLSLFFSEESTFSVIQRALILAGTGLYFTGDLNLSFHKFNNYWQKKPYWLGALLYTAGQTLMALVAVY